MENHETIMNMREFFDDFNTVKNVEPNDRYILQGFSSFGLDYFFKSKPK